MEEPEKIIKKCRRVQNAKNFMVEGIGMNKVTDAWGSKGREFNSHHPDHLQLQGLLRHVQLDLLKSPFLISLS